MKYCKKCKSFCGNCISKKDIWEQLYKSRALEISTLWQRSVFLGAFIVLLFTGYGVFFDRMLLSEGSIGKGMHWIGIILGFLIAVFGHLWIAMAQGSKRWAEIYERKIELLEKSFKTLDKQYWYVTEEFLHKTTLRNNVEANEKDDLLFDDTKNHWLRSEKMSPSKINIFIGGIILTVGGVITLIHSLFFVSCVVVVFRYYDNVLEIYYLPTVGWLFFLIIIVALISTFYIRKLFVHK